MMLMLLHTIKPNRSFCDCSLLNLTGFENLLGFELANLLQI